MKKKVWIWNHYATRMYEDQAGRHFSLAKELTKKGYEVTIFCANTVHNSNTLVSTNNKNHIIKSIGKVNFVFIKTTPYNKNRRLRLKNMYDFYKNVQVVSREYRKDHGNPDIIYASSVHPLTLVAGIKTAKKLKIDSIVEVRDLWPESFVSYDLISRENPILHFLLKGEKWIYKNADKLIFTMEGGSDYIKDQGWDKYQGGPVDLSSVYHINNGVDLEVFNYNKNHYKLDDEDLNNPATFKVVYTGSIRLVNNIKTIVDTALELKKNNVTNINILIYGDGDDRTPLEEYCRNTGLDNVIFKGSVEKKYVPYILSKSDLNILNFKQSKIKKYGASLNKMFEYFASGKPILSDCEFGYDLINKYRCGVTVDSADSKILAEEIIKFKECDIIDYKQYCENALIAAKEYDFKHLTSKLVNIIEGDK